MQDHRELLSYIIQIMNVYECNGKNIFMHEVKDEILENGKFHLSRMKTLHGSEKETYESVSSITRSSWF